MNRTPIPIEKFMTCPYQLWEKDWLLLSSGDFTAGHYNCMTIAWGSIGVMWAKPFIQVVVRPHRYTFQFMEQYATFTVCAFPKQYRRALNILGTKSGRDGNKIAEAGLTPMASETIPAPCFVEAELVLECQKIYWSDFDPNNFIDKDLDRNYPTKDYHRIYYGQIGLVRGTDKYIQERG
jgi:flavin reductase (DIM6/NTAB) family NADH-FMN oxidoreductase RutF